MIGEVVWPEGGPEDTGACSGSQGGVFFAFDIINRGRQAVWHLPFSARMQQLAMTKLPPDTDYQGDIVQQLQRKASVAQHFQQARGKGKVQPSEAPSLERKQQAPSTGNLHVVRKEHRLVTMENIEALLAGPNRGTWYPTYGLVFTPNTEAYPLGMSELLMKWQPHSSIAVDLASLPRGGARGLVVPGLAFECKPTAAALLRRSFSVLPPNIDTIKNVAPLAAPASIRFDKASGNNWGAVQALLRMAMGQQQPLGDSRSLLAAFRSHHSSQCLKAGSGSCEPVEVTGSDLGPRHPLLERPFQELRAELLAAVEDGEVQSSAEASSGLEVFNYCQEAIDIEVNRLCRGLVLHPPTQQVVAIPFLRFPELQQHQHESKQGGASPVAVTASPLYPADTLVQAALKLDGSLAIAFLWNSEIRVSTRRRMDSEQAVWAQSWIRWSGASGCGERFKGRSSCPGGGGWTWHRAWECLWHRG